MEKVRFSGVFRKSCLIVAEHCYGRKGVWAYQNFEFINDQYFSGRLPYPHIIWGLTPHGGCVAWASTMRDKSRPPIITLHPSLLGGTEKADPWSIDPRYLGPALVFDTLLHECIHIHIEWNLGGQVGSTSHNCPRWIRQVNRLAPLLGFHGIDMGASKVVRIPVEPPRFTRFGKRVTRVVRISTGNVPFRVGTGFPEALRRHLGQAANHYENNRLPPGAPRM